MRRRLLRNLIIAGTAAALLAAIPAPAAAQRRVGRSRVVVLGGYYGYPRYVFFDPWYQYGPYGPYAPYGPWGPYAYGPYYGYPDELTSSIRLEVTPRAAEVYVDGYRAGSVDDFDGFFQRLRVRPGEHELVLYLEGYRTVRQTVNVNRGADQKIRYTMVPLAGGETAGPRPVPPPDAAGDPTMQPERPRQGPGGRMPPQGPPRGPGPALNDARFGSVSIRVQPGDADVIVDGERWSGPANQDRLVIQLSEGRHHVDVQKDGFERYSSDVQVRRGETVTLNVSLLRR